MIAALLWKEYREQRGAWLAITAIGCALIVGFARLLQGSSSPDFLASRTASLLAAGVFLVWCYGMVSGAMLLAGECENETQPFLDILPARRGWLWRVKGMAALAMLAAHATVVLLVLASLGVAGSMAAAGTTVACVLAGGLVGLGWGLYCSARVETVLGAIVRAAGLQSLAAIVMAVVLAPVWVLFFSREALPAPVVVCFTLGFAALAVAAWTASARVFGLPDRLRRTPADPSAGVRGLRVLLWLTARQLGRFAVMTCAISLVGGLALYWNPMLTWPLLTLLLGVVCGVRAFGGNSQVPLLLGEQRLPLAGFWLARVTACALIAGAACLIALTGTASRLLPFLSALLPGSPGLEVGLLMRLFGERTLNVMVLPGPFLSLWVLYGFAAGLLCGLLWRRTAIAAVAATIIAAAGVMVWLPSLVGGGLRVWQTLGMPVAFLLATMALLPAWAGGRLRGRLAATSLAAALVAAAMGSGAGLWYRTIELPPAPEELNASAWLATLPDPASDETGRLTRQALLEVNVRRRTLNERPKRPLFTAFDDPPQVLSFEAQLSGVLGRGWPGGEPELSGWLDRMFRSPWPAELARAALGPPGVVIDARQLAEPVQDPLFATGSMELATGLLAVHGLRQQARGDHLAAVKDFGAGLALVRNLRYRCSSHQWLQNNFVESSLQEGLLRWLERVGDRREALQAMLQVLREHEARCPRNLKDALPANYLIALHSMPHPEGWLANAFPRDSRNQVETDPRVISAVAFLLQAPWERARQLRIFGCLLTPYRSLDVAENLGWPWSRFPDPGLRFWQSLEYSEPMGLTQARARLLQVALRLYRAENGHEALSLEALVPRYLDTIPADPLDPTGHAFRYRVSAGETISTGWTWDPKTHKQRRDLRRLRKGQGILWSVGEDHSADGGWFNIYDSRPGRGRDWIFLLDPPYE